MNTFNQVVMVLDDIKCLNIKAYDTRNFSPYFDYVVVATAMSSRQFKAAVNHLREEADASHFTIRNVEGEHTSEWVLIDLNSVIVHIFTEEGRARYDLDRIYAECPAMDITEAINAADSHKDPQSFIENN